MDINSSHKQDSRIFGLDVVRALAILLILCSHSVILLAPNSQSKIAIAFKFLGTIGVDIFFVLSGFLIGIIIIKQINLGKTKPKDMFYFWVRRWFRTLPNYYLILFVNIILYALFYNEVISGLWKYFFFIHNFSSAQPDFFTESWSLSIEEFAYVLIPLLILLLGLFKKNITRKCFLAVTLFSILLITLNRCYFNYFLFQDVSNWSASLRKVVVFRLDSIYFGFLGAYIFIYYNSLWNKYKFSFALIGIFLFIAIHTFIAYNHLSLSVESSFFNIIYLPSLSISILFCFPGFYGFNLKGKIKILITKISLLSYSLYLVNYSIVLLSLQFFVNVEELELLNKINVLISFWLISFALAFLLFKLYEVPMTNFRDSNFIKQYFNA